MISPSECRTARTLLGWSQSALGSKLSLNKSAVANFENFGRSARTIGPSLRLIFEAAGIEFVDGMPPTVRLRDRLQPAATPFDKLNASDNE